MKKEFKKYRSIENHYNEKFVNSVIENFGNETFVVSEKIHGSNFSIWCNNDGEVAFAKRTSFINDNEKFYNYEVAVNNQMLVDKVKHIQEVCRRLFFEADIVVYGELFGGKYDHKDVFKSKYGLVQKEVQYTPNIAFAAFDITLNGEYVDYNFFKRLCKGAEMITVPELMIGSLECCLKCENLFDSVVYKEFGLPPIKDNTAEGIVIKPIINRYLPNGDRVIIKSKNEKFAENKATPSYKPVKSNKLTEEEQSAYFCLQGSCTYNRFNNIVSKIGEITNKDFGMLLGEMIKDCIEEYNKLHTIPFKSKENFDTKKISSAFQKYVANFIRPFFVSLLSGK
jgi:Rnl2 family RNA ligase